MSYQAYRAEYIIVGAGYAGLMAALTLGQAGRDVIVLDASAIGGNTPPLPGRNQSAISGGHVTYGYSQEYDFLSEKYGFDYAQKLFQLSLRGVDLVEKNCRELNIEEAAFRRGYLILARNAREEHRLIEHLNQTEKYSATVGIERLVGAEETKRLLVSPAFQSCSLYSSLHGQLEPRAYIEGLARAAVKSGVRIFGSTEVKRFRISAHSASVISTKGVMFSGHHMIVSGGTKILRGGHFPVMRKYQATAGNYAVKTNPLPPEVITQIFPSGYQGAFADMRRSDVLYARLDSQNCLDFGAFSFGGSRPNGEAVEKLLYDTFPQLSAAGVGIEKRRYGYLAGTRQEIVQIFQAQPDGEVVPIRAYNPASRLIVLSAFGAEGINMGTTTGQAAAQALLGDATNVNILAHIEHDKLPVTFPWEPLNRMRDRFLAKTLSVIDTQASQPGIRGAFARAASEMI